MDLCIKKEIGCFSSFLPIFKNICIKRNNTLYFYTIDERKRSSFLERLYKEYSFCGKDEKGFYDPPFVLYQLLLDTFVSLVDLKRYLENKPIERFEKDILPSTFRRDILYDGHISFDMKKSILSYYFSFCMENADMFHTMILKRMQEDIGLFLEKPKRYTK